MAMASYFFQPIRHEPAVRFNRFDPSDLPLRAQRLSLREPSDQGHAQHHVQLPNLRRGWTRLDSRRLDTAAATRSAL